MRSTAGPTCSQLASGCNTKSPSWVARLTFPLPGSRLMPGTCSPGSAPAATLLGSGAAPWLLQPDSASAATRPAPTPVSSVRLLSGRPVSGAVMGAWSITVGLRRLAGRGRAWGGSRGANARNLASRPCLEPTVRMCRWARDFDEGSLKMPRGHASWTTDDWPFRPDVLGLEDHPVGVELGVVNGENRRRRRLLLTTNTELNAIAPPAMSGLSRPRAASGMAATL